MKLHIYLTLTMLMLLTAKSNFAQENTNIDSLSLTVKQMENLYNTLSKIKISGYIQAQFQAATEYSINSYEGGNFPRGTGNRFMLRRGRLKVQHGAKFSLSVVQIDATEKGVGIKDAFITLSEPLTKTLSMTMGIFNRPFGFELPYSSSVRESPERGRMSQILFPGERDLGLMLSFQPLESSSLRFIKMDAGIFNGNGPSGDFDSSKDFIGRIRFKDLINTENVKFSIAGSYYNGRWVQESNIGYEIGINIYNVPAFVPVIDDNNYHSTPREYIGGDAQFSFNWLAGITTLRGEYIFGKQSGLQNSSMSPSSATQPTGSAYVRNFDGAYFYFILDILNSGHQLVIKYDWYDPNTDVEGNQIGGVPINNLSSAEIKYESLGFGLNFNITEHLKFMTFFQTVKNEIANIIPYHEDVKDDVLTLRLQHKF